MRRFVFLALLSFGAMGRVAALSTNPNLEFVDISTTSDSIREMADRNIWFYHTYRFNWFEMEAYIPMLSYHGKDGVNAVLYWEKGEWKFEGNSPKGQKEFLDEFRKQIAPIYILRRK